MLVVTLALLLSNCFGSIFLIGVVDPPGLFLPPLPPLPTLGILILIFGAPEVGAPPRLTLSVIFSLISPGTKHRFY